MTNAWYFGVKMMSPTAKGLPALHKVNSYIASKAIQHI